ncbi:MAG TPA: hypothetical protein EYN91_24850 [Candidatus Melainabacteria bacterium]|nr:hypothetical protein [Candidatus Melainabacteria bacterium]HIN63209.1 hypothetical protein [Candidatus Obscuribacterales bacterium]
MRLIKHITKHRNEAGSSFIEVGIASVAMAVIVFLAMDAYVWMQAFMLNDIACRDACRAAAQAQGTTNTVASYKTAAQNAAIRELTLHSVTRPYIGNPTFVAGGFVWQDFGASNGGALPAPPQTPFVRVQSSMNVNLPIPLNAFGGLQAKPLVFQRSYSMPIVNIPPP